MGRPLERVEEELETEVEDLVEMGRLQPGGHRRKPRKGLACGLCLGCDLGGRGGALGVTEAGELVQGDSAAVAADEPIEARRLPIIEPAVARELEETLEEAIRALG